MSITYDQRRMIIAEKEQLLKQIEIYTTLAKANTGWFGDWGIEYDAREKIRGLMSRINMLDKELFENHI